MRYAIGTMTVDDTLVEFMDRARNICTTINRETSLDYRVVQVNEKQLFDIIEANRHIEQSSDYAYIIGYLNGVIRILREFKNAADSCPINSFFKQK